MSITEEISYDKDGKVERFPLFKKLFLSIIIILVAFLSFGIGRLSVVGKREGIKIEYDSLITNNQAASVVNALQGNGGVIASKNGSKYHYSHCPGAKQIKERNKITFNSSSEAEAAGYILAANCKSP